MTEQNLQRARLIVQALTLSAVGSGMMSKPATNPGWLDTSMLVGAGLFIFALVLSAVFDPSIRVLHALQALIYVAVIILTRRGSSWGFGAGCSIAAFWNYTNLFVTTFISAGLDQFVIFVHTGQLHRPDLVVALIAAAGHFLMIVACVVGFLRTRPKLRQWGEFLCGGMLAVAYFVAIVFTTGPQYIALVKEVFGLN